MKRWIHASEEHRYKCEPKFYYNGQLQHLKSYETTAVSEKKAISNLKYKIALQLADNQYDKARVYVRNIRYDGKVYDLSEESYNRPQKGDRAAEREQRDFERDRQAELSELNDHRNSNDYDFEEHDDDDDIYGGIMPSPS